MGASAWTNESLRMRPQQQKRRPDSIAPDARLPVKILSPSAAFTWSVRACGVLTSLWASRRAVGGEQAREGALEPVALHNSGSKMSSWQASGLLVHSGADAVLVPYDTSPVPTFLHASCYSISSLLKLHSRRSKPKSVQLDY